MPPASTSADPRRRAVLALARVDARGAHAARLLGDASGFEREVVLGVLRWRLTLDTLLGAHCRRPLAELDPEVRALLRAGLFEALRLRTPVAVAVAEAVRVAKWVAPAASGLVNAVLRRATAEPWPDPDDRALPLSLRFSHPEWLVERWRALLGDEAVLAAVVADQEPAPVALLSAVSRVAELEAGGCALEAHPTVAGVSLVRAGVEAAVAALTAGRAYAIDPTAVLVARLLPDVPGLIVDLAAAPGGKSLVLGAERSDRTRLACDRHIGRAALMRRTLSLLAVPPAIVIADAALPALRPNRCAAILLDAPCSGTGTLRRHPEIRWRLRREDLSELTTLQRGLAASAAALLAPGGFLLYSTCSLEPEENAHVVAGLPLEVVALGPRIPPGVPRIELPSGGVLIPPGPHGDGFTAHLLRA